MENLIYLSPATGDTGLPAWIIPALIAAAVIVIACILVPLFKKK